MIMIFMKFYDCYLSPQLSILGVVDINRAKNLLEMDRLIGCFWHFFLSTEIGSGHPVTHAVFCRAWNPKMPLEMDPAGRRVQKFSRIIRCSHRHVTFCFCLVTLPTVSLPCSNFCVLFMTFWEISWYQRSFPQISDQRKNLLQMSVQREITSKHWNIMEHPHPSSRTGMVPTPTYKTASKLFWR